jgi:hypothetical protein
VTTKRHGGQVVDDRALDRDRDADQDPGSYIGRMPERASETIPGGVSDADERVAAHSTQSGPTAGRPAPSGHRDGPPATDDTVREAGQDR